MSFSSVRVHASRGPPGRAYVENMLAHVKVKMSSGDCCPAGSIGQTAPGGGVGYEIILGMDLPAYVVGDASSKRAVVCIYDIYGYVGGRVRQVCDEMAAEGYFVVLPDLFRGDAWSTERDDSTKMEWMKSVSEPAKVEADLTDTVLPWVKAQGVDAIGVVGLCFGGYAGWLASKTGLVQACVGVHSATKLFNFHGTSEWDQVPLLKCPQMLLQAGNDPANTKPGGEVSAALARQAGWGAECEFEEYADMLHGWLPRGDLDDPKVRRGCAAAMRRLLAFLDKHLSSQ